MKSSLSVDTLQTTENPIEVVVKKILGMDFDPTVAVNYRVFLVQLFWSIISDY